MTGKISILALIVALIALAVVTLRPVGNAVAPEKKETAFARVMRTHTIRCGYAVWNPVLYKDAKTGEIKGIAHDVMEEVGKKLDLRIDWAEETGWGTLVEGLATHRYDAICNALGVISPRARVIDFSAPLFYGATYIVVRQDETRFSHNEDMNNPAYSFSVLEGEAAALLLPKVFPKAHLTPLPQNADFSLVFQDVATRKADAAVVDYSSFVEYQKVNPGKLKILEQKPIEFYSASFGLPQGDVALKSMIDVALGEAFADGTLGRAIDAYSEVPDEFLKPAKPYAGP